MNFTRYESRISGALFVICAIFVLALAFMSIPVQAQDQPGVYAIEGAKIYTLAGPPIENGTVVIRDGKIAAVGANVDVPAGAQVIDAKGLEVYPGMIDPITQTGLVEVAAVPATVDESELGDFNPDLVAATAVNPASAHIPVTRASGITEVIATPGIGGMDSRGGGLIPGQASAFSLAGWTMDEMQLNRSVAMVINWPTLSSRTFDFSTFTMREGSYADAKKEYDKKVDELTDWLDRARHYAQAESKGSPADYERDLKLEALVPVVEGKLPVLVVAQRARDIRNAVEFCAKQDLKMILAGGGEAWKVKDLLKEKKIPVILGPTERLPLDEDTPYDEPMTQPSQLYAAGIPIAFSSFDTSFSRRLSQYAGTAVGYGLPHDEALKAVMLNAAQMFGLADQVGTIEVGKVGNLIVTDGDPLEIQTAVRYLFIRGQLTSTENRHHELYEEYRKRP
ncbi:MAG TPA: amidohydrolase family protein [Candidatus Acidoferrales bacterium]|nr:amidohydrolase family protein [Candidatus Acidoferrales bacterium]